MYKNHIGKLVVGEYDISSFIDEISVYLKSDCERKNLERATRSVPPLDKKFLNLLRLLREDYAVYLVSDIYRELGEEVRKKLHRHFDAFVFSYEERAKKSQKHFWETLKQKIPFEDCKLFIDDKAENVAHAEEYGIPGIVYGDFSGTKNVILEYPLSETRKHHTLSRSIVNTVRLFCICLIGT